MPHKPFLGTMGFVRLATKKEERSYFVKLASRLWLWWCSLRWWTWQWSSLSWKRWESNQRFQPNNNGPQPLVWYLLISTFLICMALAKCGWRRSLSIPANCYELILFQFNGENFTRESKLHSELVRFGVEDHNRVVGEQRFSGKGGMARPVQTCSTWELGGRGD